MRLERSSERSIMAQASEEQPLQQDKVKPSCFVVRIKLIARMFGVLTVVIMWVSVVVSIHDDNNSYIGWYLIPVAILVSFFELTWLFNKCACCGREGCCCRVWSVIMWIDNWKKFVLYLLLSVPLFLEGLDMALGVVSGFLLILLSMLYLVKTFLDPLSYDVTRMNRMVKLDKSPAISVVTVEVSTQTDLFMPDTPATLDLQDETGEPDGQ